MYASDAPGTIRAPSEYTEFDDDEDLPLRLAAFAASIPVLVDQEDAAAQTPAPKRALRPREVVSPAETGRPETSKEFAKRIRKLLLHGLRYKPTEGVSPEDTNTNNQHEVTTVIESAD